MAKIVAAASPARLAIQIGEKFIVRNPFGPDEEIPWDGDSKTLIDALVCKWGFHPVVGDQEIGDYDAAVIEEVKMNDGSLAWKITEKIHREKQ